MKNMRNFHVEQLNGTAVQVWKELVNYLQDQMKWFRWNNWRETIVTYFIQTISKLIDFGHRAC